MKVEKVPVLDGCPTEYLKKGDMFMLELLKRLLHIIIIINTIIKKHRQCKDGRGRLTPYQSKDPSHTLPTYRGKKRKIK